MYCKNCGAELPRNAVGCNGCGTRVGKTVATTVCPTCGYVAMAPAMFCKNCGASLQEQRPRSDPAESPVSAPSPSARTMAAESTRPSSAEKPCPHCGAPVGAGAKFCKQCGKPPSEAVPGVATPPPKAAQPLHVPPAAAVRRPPETVPFHAPARVKRGSLVLVAGLSTLVVLGATIGYVKIHKRALSERANTERLASANAANPGAAQPLPPGAEQASTAPTEPQNPSQVSQPPGTVASTPVPPPAPTRRRTTAATEAPPSAPVAAPYQQAHQYAEQALVDQRYIEPPDASALYWARTARQQGDPGADQIEQQVLDSVEANARAASAMRNYEEATALLTKLGSFFPNRPEIERMILEVRQKQQEYAKQLERQRQAAELQAQTKQFPLRHRHLVGMQGIRPQYSYCEGILKITPDGIARFDCTRTEDPRGRCDHIVLNAGNIKEVRPNRDGSIRVATTSSGNLDFYGDPAAVQGSLNALQALVRR